MQGLRILCRAKDGALWSVPVDWTDRVELGLELLLGKGGSYFLVGDLLALSDLISRKNEPDGGQNV